MDKNSLNHVFHTYLEKFHELNIQHEEYYKWQAAYDFQQIFDIDAMDFAAMLMTARNATENLIDSYTQPFYGLAKLAEFEPENVRELFRALYAPDGGDLDIRQNKIKVFLQDCNRLIEKYFPGSYLYKNDQRSAMAYLFLYDPDNQFLYKATEAKYFADHMGFYDDWGTMGDFDLKTYYRFCNELVDTMRHTALFDDIKKERLKYAEKPMHEDENMHILAFDIIYCAYRYQLYSGYHYDKVTSRARLLYQERRTEAQKRLEAEQKAEHDMREFEEFLQYCEALIQSGAVVKHSRFGELIDGRLEQGTLIATEKRSGVMKRLDFMYAVHIKAITILDEEFSDRVKACRLMIARAKNIPSNFKKAKDDLDPYRAYL